MKKQNIFLRVIIILFSLLFCVVAIGTTSVGMLFGGARNVITPDFWMDVLGEQVQIGTVLNTVGNHEKYAEDERPIAEECSCPACRNYSRSYIRHLFKAREALGMRLAVLHNLYFYNDLMQKIRDALDEGRYEEFYHTYVDLLAERRKD